MQKQTEEKLELLADLKRQKSMVEKQVEELEGELRGVLYAEGLVEGEVEDMTWAEAESYDSSLVPILLSRGLDSAITQMPPRVRASGVQVALKTGMLAEAEVSPYRKVDISFRLKRQGKK